MYAFIRGTVSELAADRAVIDAMGVGYELQCSAATLRKLTEGADAKLYAHLHLAEGVMALYGFYTTEERDMFRRLLGVTRVGPKLSLAVLSVLSPGDVRAAVLTDNPAAFDRVTGMGRKSAQRVILELREHVSDGAPSLCADAGGAAPDIRQEAVAALTTLGYDGLSASRAVAAVEQASTVEECITKALRLLAK